MTIRKTIALWMWPGLEQADIDAIRAEAFAQGCDAGREEYAKAAARLKAKPEHEKSLSYVPSMSSARDVAGYSAQTAAQDIRKALQRLSDETGGMSAEVEVDWQEYQFIESDTTRAFLDRVTVKTGSVRATA